MKRKGRFLLFSVSLVTALIAVFFIAVWVSSPGKLPVLRDIDGKVIAGSLSEKGWAQIGGIPQGFFIRSENPSNPVLLFLHGGPGSPELPFIMAKETAERPEKYFTVCYWDQRGAGMTYRKDTDAEAATVAQMVEDTKEMTEYLMRRFGVSQIYLAGHSWGSYLGIKTIEKYPQLYAAYIGIGQVTNQLKSERLAYDYITARSHESGDKSALKRLAKFDKTASDFPSNAYLTQVRTPLMNKYGVGIEHKNFSMAAMVRDLLFFTGYTFSDKVNYMGGMGFSLVNIFGAVIDDNLFESSPSVNVPVYITQGVFDYQVSHALAKQYSQVLNAPQKVFYSFENSAHSPNIEESARFTQVLNEVSAANPAK